MLLVPGQPSGKQIVGAVSTATGEPARKLCLFNERTGRGSLVLVPEPLEGLNMKFEAFFQYKVKRIVRKGEKI